MRKTFLISVVSAYHRGCPEAVERDGGLVAKYTDEPARCISAILRRTGTMPSAWFGLVPPSLRRCQGSKTTAALATTNPNARNATDVAHGRGA
jgi:hypothetical protein